MSKAWVLLSFAQARLGDDKLAARWNWTVQKRWAMAQQGREGLGEAVEKQRKAKRRKCVEKPSNGNEKQGGALAEPGEAVDLL